jgi:hypothetical protein
MKRYFYVIVIAAIVVIAYDKIYNAVMVDMCLDKGFAWDYPQNKCIKDRLSFQGIECLSKHKSWDEQNKICKQ